MLSFEVVTMCLYRPSTDERLTPRAGEAILGECFKAIGIDTFVTITFLHLKVTAATNHSK